MDLLNAVRAPRLAGSALVALSLAASISTATAQQRTEPDIRDQIEARVDEAVADGFVGQILAVHDGEILFQGGYGLADPESGAAVDPRTVFPIGSVTKQFTRAAILKLEEEGALSTDDAIGTYLPDLPTDKRDISIDHVMSMRAGFHEYHDDEGDHQPMTRAEALARIGAQELLFEPGTQRAYSNSGFALLAAIVEVASGRSFNEYVREKLFEPAGLRSTGFHGELLWEDPIVARGHGAMRHGENQPHRWPAVTWALMGGGGIVAPAEDLWRWIAAVRGGEVLGKAALAKFYPTPEAELVYAGGDDFGFTTVVVELAGGRDAVIVNNHSGNMRERLAIEIAESMHGAPLVALRERMGIREISSTDNVEVGGPGGEIPDSPRARASWAFEQALMDGSDDALREMVETLFAPEMRDAFPIETHLEQLRQLSDLARAAQSVVMMPRSEFEVDLIIGRGDERTTIMLGLEDQPPHRITGVRISN